MINTHKIVDTSSVSNKHWFQHVGNMLRPVQTNTENCIYKVQSKQIKLTPGMVMKWIGNWKIKQINSKKHQKDPPTNKQTNKYYYFFVTRQWANTSSLHKVWRATEGHCSRPAIYS